jgi:cell division protein FtsB
MAARAGGAARGAAHTRQAGATGWLRGIRFSWFSFVMLGLLVLGVLVIAPTLKLYVEQRQQIADLEAQNAQQQKKVDDLQKLEARWSDPSYIRAEARDRLLYVMPGETSYLVIDDRAPKATESKAPVSRELQKTKTDWLGALFGSVVTAGLSNETAAQLAGESAK